MSLQPEPRSGGIETFEDSKEMKAEVTSQNQVYPRRICQVIWLGVINKLNEWWNFLEEEIPKSCQSLDLVDQRRG
jgi:hypothetical protein